MRTSGPVCPRDPGPSPPPGRHELAGAPASADLAAAGEGVVYTPAALAGQLVRATLAGVLRDLPAAGPGDGEDAWQRRGAALGRLRVLDPACGAGALLLAAHDELLREHARVGRAIARLGGRVDAPGRAIVRDNLHGVDLDAAGVAAARSALWRRAAEGGEAPGPDAVHVLQADSVVGDAALAPYAFDWERGCLAREGAGDDAERARWRAPFDVVIGNPPFVRHELLTDRRAHWRAAYRVFDGSADLYVYFFERALQRLRPGGRLGFIVANKWLRGGYAAPLRELLARETTIESLVDFGHAPLFAGADAFPCVVVLRKAPAGPRHRLRVTQSARGTSGAKYGDSPWHAVPQARLGSAPWDLEPADVHTLLRKIRRAGPALTEYAGDKPYYGVKTGCNAAFIVDDATRDRLVREDPACARVLKKCLRGQDLGRWGAEWAGLWLILSRRGADVGPAVLRHLEGHRARLEPCPPGQRGAGWPGRKGGNYEWWELQDPVEYHGLFARPKIVYQEIQYHPAYAIDRDGHFLNNKGFMIPGEDLWLLAVLNSPLMWWHNWRHLVHLKDEALCPAGDRVAALPIALPSPVQRDAIAAAVPRIEGLVRAERDGRAAVSEALMRLDVVAPGRLVDVATLSRDALVEGVARRRGARRPLLPGEVAALGTLHAREAAAARERQAQSAAIERTIAAHVHGAYGLTAGDEALLWATAPPRMPWRPEE